MHACNDKRQTMGWVKHRPDWEGTHWNWTVRVPFDYQGFEGPAGKFVLVL